MHRITKWLSILLLGLFTTTLYADNVGKVNLTPEGYWKTIDDVSGKPKSIIKIWKAKNAVLMGKIIKIFPKEGFAENKKCTACSGKYHNKSIVGLVILSGLKIKHNQWNRGQILDPENGKTYSCSLRMTNNGNFLNVHGYIGMPLLGRSQIWERVDLMSAK